MSRGTYTSELAIISAVFDELATEKNDKKTIERYNRKNHTQNWQNFPY